MIIIRWCFSPWCQAQVVPVLLNAVPEAAHTILPTTEEAYNCALKWLWDIVGSAGGLTIFSEHKIRNRKHTILVGMWCDSTYTTGNNFNTVVMEMEWAHAVLESFGLNFYLYYYYQHHVYIMFIYIYHIFFGFQNF